MPKAISFFVKLQTAADINANDVFSNFQGIQEGFLCGEYRGVVPVAQLPQSGTEPQHLFVVTKVYDFSHLDPSEAPRGDGQGGRYDAQLATFGRGDTCKLYCVRHSPHILAYQSRQVRFVFDLAARKHLFFDYEDRFDNQACMEYLVRYRDFHLSEKFVGARGRCACLFEENSAGVCRMEFTDGSEETFLDRSRCTNSVVMAWSGNEGFFDADRRLLVLTRRGAEEIEVRNVDGALERNALPLLAEVRLDRAASLLPRRKVRFEI